MPWHFYRVVYENFDDRIICDCLWREEGQGLVGVVGENDFSLGLRMNGTKEDLDKTTSAAYSERIYFYATPEMALP